MGSALSLHKRFVTNMKYWISILAGLLLMACNERIDTKAYKEELKTRQIKRVSSEQVTALSDIWGKNIVRILNQRMGSNTAADSLAKRYVAQIRLLSVGQLAGTTLDATQRQILEAYQYNAQNNIPQTDNVQKLNGGEQMLFTSPVIWNEQLAKLSPSQKTDLAKRYALDSLSYRKVGDWIGIWSIVFDKKELIRRTDAKALDKLRNQGVGTAK
jgi:membrane-associated HD superfamily phosphohydrolase